MTRSELRVHPEHNSSMAKKKPDAQAVTEKMATAQEMSEIDFQIMGLFRQLPPEQKSIFIDLLKSLPSEGPEKEPSVQE